MTPRAADPREHVAPLARFARQLEWRRRSEQPHEHGRQLGLVVAELGIRRRVGARWNRRSRDGFLGRNGGRRDALLRTEGAVVELAQGGHQRLASEPADTAVEEAIRSPRDAVPDSEILAYADPEDRDHDGISG